MLVGSGQNIPDPTGSESGSGSATLVAEQYKLHGGGGVGCDVGTGFLLYLFVHSYTHIV